MQKLRLRGFARVRRGLTVHLQSLSPAEAKLFLAYLLQANPFGDKKQPDRICELSNEQMAHICGWSRQWLIAVKGKLIQRGFIMSLDAGVKIPKFNAQGSTILDPPSQGSLTPPVNNPLPLFRVNFHRPESYKHLRISKRIKRENKKPNYLPCGNSLHQSDDEMKSQPDSGIFKTAKDKFYKIIYGGRR